MEGNKRDELSRLRERVARLEEENAELVRQVRVRDGEAAGRTAELEQLPRTAAKRRWLLWLRNNFPDDMTRIDAKATRLKADVWSIAAKDGALVEAKAARRQAKRLAAQQARRHKDKVRKQFMARHPVEPKWATKPGSSTELQDSTET